MKNLEPIHPGEILAEEFLLPMEYAVEAQKLLGLKLENSVG